MTQFVPPPVVSLTRSAPRKIGALPISLLALAVSCLPAAPSPPCMLVQSSGAVMSLVRMPDGSFAFYNRTQPALGPLTLPDRDGRPYPLLPGLPASIVGNRAMLESGVLANPQVLMTRDEQVVGVYVRAEVLDKAAVQSVGLSRYLNVWMHRADPTAAGQPRLIWRGYNGSQMEYQQFASGRIIVPFGSMQPHAKATPPTGRHATVVLFSDDAGGTWQQSSSRLVAPCYAGFNGSNEGACEPAIEMLRDGRVWMLLRTQAGFLYESFSADEGATWSPATASRFGTSTGPSNILRHQNGWLVVTWNNCELPLKHEGQGVYGGRDALHMAVSDDDGRTWRGFREIYLDFRRNGNPEKTGDRGTAYPLGTYTADGNIVVLAGQGAGGRNPIVVDPAWIVATSADADFSDGLEQWSVYKHHGPAKGWWRGRTVGCALVPDPADPTRRSLHVRKPDDHPADVAVWNFPNGWKGTLTARVMLRRGGQGGMVCLNDRFFDPSEENGQEFAVFRTPLGADGKDGAAGLAPDVWHELALKWDLSAGKCRVRVNDRDAGTLSLATPTINGISYVRFVSRAKEIDPEGFLVGSVRVSIEDPCAPVVSAGELSRHERRYVETMVPLWNKRR
jgi:hypothetical protein